MLHDASPVLTKAVRVAVIVPAFRSLAQPVGVCTAHKTRAGTFVVRGTPPIAVPPAGSRFDGVAVLQRGTLFVENQNLNAIARVGIGWIVQGENKLAIDDRQERLR
jgi:hypothetical protein